jgi:hypothetical protein
LGVAGASALVAGTTLFVSARISYDAARDHCSTDNECPDPYYDRQESARTRATVSYVVMGSGALLVGAAAVLHFGLARDQEQHARLSAIVLGPRDFSAAYTGAF